MPDITTLDVVARLVVALLCGGIIGWERGWHDKPAGMRTHILVAIGTAAFVLMVVRFIGEIDGHADELMIDPTRVLQGILAGVGLIAGGVIIQGGGSVHGLTSAGTIWATTAVGSACGYGHFDIAVILTVLILLTTVVLVRFDPKEHPAGKGPSPQQDSLMESE